MAAHRTEVSGVEPDRAAALRERYGPSPWWDEDRFRELVFEHGLRSRDFAAIWNVSTTTVDEWAQRYGLDRKPPLSEELSP